jgi:small subunit ribosomal protein S18
MRGLKSKKPRKIKQVAGMKLKKFRRKVLSLSQLVSKLLASQQKFAYASQQQKRGEQQKLAYASQQQKPVQPIIPPKTLIIILKEKPEKQVYNRRIIDYKHCGLLQRYIGLGGKILPRRQTRLTAKQQRFVSKTIKTARVMGLLPFVNKERSFYR